MIVQCSSCGGRFPTSYTLTYSGVALPVDGYKARRRVHYCARCAAACGFPREVVLGPSSSTFRVIIPGSQENTAQVFELFDRLLGKSPEAIAEELGSEGGPIVAVRRGMDQENFRSWLAAVKQRMEGQE